MKLQIPKAIWKSPATAAMVGSLLALASPPAGAGGAPQGCPAARQDGIYVLDKSSPPPLDVLLFVHRPGLRPLVPVPGAGS